ncbi:MAG TPA: DUF5915 domain-containing protein, partial [Nocardioides sp.]
MLPTGFIVLDTVVTPELAAEGLARDLIRAVQQARKDSGLNVEDRITLAVTGSEAVRRAATTHADLISRETLATTYDVVDSLEGNPVDLGDGEKAQIAVTKA